MEQAKGSSRPLEVLRQNRGSRDPGVPTLAFSLLPLNSQTLSEQRSGGSGKSCNKVRLGQRIGGREEELPKRPSDLYVLGYPRECWV